MVEDRGDSGLETLQGQTDNLVDVATDLTDPATNSPCSSA
jgi:hypothetical protein